PTASPGTGSATVTWTAPSTNNGSSIVAYIVTPFLGGVAQTPQTFNSTATTEIVTGLTNASSYTFKVAARNANGTGPQSVATVAIVVGTPTAPTGVTATAATGAATVFWTKSSTDNGSTITAYIVTSYVAGVAHANYAFSASPT